MASKSLKILSLSVLFLVVLMSAVSADLTFSPISSSAVQGESASDTFSIGADTDDISDIIIPTPITLNLIGSIETIEVVLSNIPTGLLSGESKDITFSVEVPLDQEIGGYEGVIQVTGTGITGTKDIPLSLTITQSPLPTGIIACSLIGNPDGDLSVEIDDIKVINGFGDDDEWLPFDEIEIEVTVENNNDDYDIEDIELSWGLYNLDTGKWYIDDDENDFDLKDGEEESLTFTFTLDEDIDELEDGNYRLYVWANGNLDGDSDLCASDSKEINVIIEEDFVILDNVQIPEIASCGDELKITTDVWNIGDEDQDDVFVLIYNKELGINKKVEIGDIDAFEDEKLEVTINIPKDVEEKQYDLIFTVFDEDGEIYENDYDDQKSEFFVPLSIEGNCKLGADVSLTAVLESDAIAGKELIVKVTITNTKDNSEVYSLDITDYNDWATLESIEPKTIIVESENSEEVLLTFKINKDASGDKLFNINLNSDDETILEQPVSLTIKANSGFNFPGITGNIISEGNWYLWGIGALNVVLVLIIILVAVRVAKKSE